MERAASKLWAKTLLYESSTLALNRDTVITTHGCIVAPKLISGLTQKNMDQLQDTDETQMTVR